jgi:hypothetical protein
VKRPSPPLCPAKQASTSSSGPFAAPLQARSAPSRKRHCSQHARNAEDADEDREKVVGEDSDFQLTDGSSDEEEPVSNVAATI